jgi:hypothetical protein
MVRGQPAAVHAHPARHGCGARARRWCRGRRRGRRRGRSRLGQWMIRGQPAAVHAHPARHGRRARARRWCRGGSGGRRGRGRAARERVIRRQPAAVHTDPAGDRRRARTRGWRWRWSRGGSRRGSTRRRVRPRQPTAGRKRRRNKARKVAEASAEHDVPGVRDLARGDARIIYRPRARQRVFAVERESSDVQFKTQRCVQAAVDTRQQKRSGDWIESQREGVIGTQPRRRDTHREKIPGPIELGDPRQGGVRQLEPRHHV